MKGLQFSSLDLLYIKGIQCQVKIPYILVFKSNA